MNTPSSQLCGTPLGNAGPPASFLQQLLNEINGTATPTGARKAAPKGETPRSHTDSRATGRRTPSVWVGGTAVAEDARHKLCAADEARRGRASNQATDGTPETYEMSTYLLTPSSLGSFSSSSSSLNRPLAYKPSEEDQDTRGCHCAASTEITGDDVTQSMEGWAHGTLDKPPLTFTKQPVWSAADVATSRSPPLFCDVDSDVSSTPPSPPSEAPTSALTTNSTNTTYACDGSSPLHDSPYISRRFLPMR